MSVDFDNDSEETLSIYCQRDTDITYLAFLRYIRFVHDNKLGRFSLSRASQSMAAFRHRFMAVKIYNHTEEDIVSLEEESYYGGRTEAFQLGKIENGPFVDLDINSMYPFIMKSMKMPVKCFDYHTNISVIDLTCLMIEYGSIADVEIETDTPAYAIRIDGKVIFPIGRFRIVLCTASLLYALKNGHIRRVYRCAVYEMDYPFVEYVDYFYDVRQRAKKEGDDITQRMAKLFMNSLYGKFAQREEIVVDDKDIVFDGYFRLDVYDPITKQNEILTKLFNRQITTSGSKIMKRSVVAIPSHVTDYGRIMLWNIIESTGRDRSIYCDTDSIKIRKSDHRFVKHPQSDTSLGHLKVESEYTHLEIYGPKDYVTERQVKLKGVPKRAIKNSDGSYSYQQFLRMGSHLRRGEIKSFIVKDITKRLRRIYTKGRVNPDLSVSPWILPDDLPLPK